VDKAFLLAHVNQKAHFKHQDVPVLKKNILCNSRCHNSEPCKNK